MKELAEIIANTEPVQAVCIAILVVGCAFALAWFLGTVIKSLFDLFKKLAD